MYDDSGVAMAYTVLVSLFIFMLCVSTFAMTENIRQKMELQNACDAAAYSGAVVQADMLSRIAVLNRALSWTYAETNKRHMDAIVNDWLVRVVNRYDEIADAAERSYLESSTCRPLTAPENGASCPMGHGCWAICWFAGYRGNSEYVRLNGTQTVDIEDIRLANSAYLRRDDSIIENGYSNITVLNNEIASLRADMNRFIGQAILYSMQSFPFGISGRYNYYLDGAWGNTAEPTYILAQTNEETFLNYSGATQAGDFGAGYGNTPGSVWWNLSCSTTNWWSAEESNNSGFIRAYNQGDALRAEGTAYANSHYHETVGAAVVHVASRTSASPWDLNVSGRLLVDPTPARPATLSSNFFGQAGSIVVAAKKTMVNPFSAISGIDTDSGVYAGFNGNGRDMWVVSAARAGVCLNGTAGSYSVLQPNPVLTGSARYTSGVWNLCEEDWDAVMIPVNRAWNNTAIDAWGTDENGNDTKNADTNRLFASVRTALGGVVSSYGRDGNYVTPENPVRH